MTTLHDLILALGLTLIAMTGCFGDPLADGDTSVDLAVDAVSPARVPSRGGVEVTLIGKNFAEDVTVTVDGSPALGVVRHDASRITFVTPRLPVGNKELVVANPSGQHVDRTDALRVYADDVQFQDRTTILDHAYVDSFLLGDLDGDGLDDVVTTGFNPSSGAIEVTSYLDRDGGRSLERRALVRSIAPSTAFHLELLDVTGDGLADLVDESGVWIASGDGTFGPHVPILDPAVFVQQAVLGDFVGDGRKELLLFTNGPAFRVSVTQGGAVTVEATYPGLSSAPTFGDATRPLARDLDGDGIDDLVLTDGTDGKLRSRLGPDFVAAWTSPLTGSHEFLDLQDIDRDGRWDIVTNFNGALVYPGLGDGTFGPAQGLNQVVCAGLLHDRLPPTPEQRTWATCSGSLAGWSWVGGQPYETARIDAQDLGAQPQLANLDGDANADVVTIGAPGELRAHFGSGFRSSPVELWGSPLSAAANAGPALLARGHFGSGRTLAAAVFDKVVLLDTATLQPIAQVTAGNALELVACDADHDGNDDLVLHTSTMYEGDTLQVILVHGDALALGQQLPAGSINFLEAGDLDGDGDCDLFGVPHGLMPITSSVWRGGPGGFVPSGELAGLRATDFVQSLDLDRDGDTDFIGFGERTTGTLPIEIWWNEGGGTLRPQVFDVATFAPTAGGWTDVLGVRAQVRADGAIEVWSVVKDLGSADHLLRFVVGADRVAADVVTADLPFSAQRRYIALGDANGDGMFDALVGPSSDGYEAATDLVVVMSGDQGLAETRRIATQPGARFAPHGFDFFDVDGDGLDDILFGAEAYGGKLALVHNQSD